MMYFRVHSKLRMVLAIIAGVSDRLWEIGDVVAIVEAAQTKPGNGGAY